MRESKKAIKVQQRETELMGKRDGFHESGMPKEEEVEWQVRAGEREAHAKMQGRSTEVNKSKPNCRHEQRTEKNKTDCRRKTKQANLQVRWRVAEEQAQKQENEKKLKNEPHRRYEVGTEKIEC